ncbi:MAG: Calx-beta domain-containing protein, partial [Synechococcaceae cyanobacterium]|nr:Calx-beta domain-containing protein [Synechococcaceae cyanobacterium]
MAGQLSSGVTQIFSNQYAFAALKADGSVVTWGGGGSSYGGNSSAVAGQLSSGVTQIFSTGYAFAALKADGSVVTWGDSFSGGAYGSDVAVQLSSGVTQIFSTDYAFAALKADGSVVTWGGANLGGNSSGVAAQLSSGVTQIFSTNWAFAALKTDGSVITWGLGWGGDSSAVSDLINSGVIKIYSNLGAFAALKEDGSVVTWGDSRYGGDSSGVSDKISSGVTQIVSTSSQGLYAFGEPIADSGGAFAALKADGSVVTWGDSSHGGDSSSVAGQLTNVVAFANPFTDDRLEVLKYSEQGALSFSQSSYSINENGTAVNEIVMVRSGGSTGEVSAMINLVNGSATAPADYSNTPITVRFAAGETSKVVNIPIVNDSKVESNETIQLSLSTPTGGAILWGRIGATATIVDDDLELNFSSRTYRASEDGLPEAQISINRSGVLSVPVAVTLVARNGSATAPHDYLDTSIVVAFAPGEASRTVTLPIVDDDDIEAEETILLSLVDATNGATIGSQGNATLTITSDDWPDLVVSNITAPIGSQSGQPIDITW